MPTKSVKLIPGVNVERTPTLNEAGISYSSFGRFRDGLFQKIGGWQQYYNLSSGIPRAMHAWQDLNNVKHLAVGTTSSFITVTNNASTNLTPQTKTTNFAPKFSTTSGSNQVLIDDSNISNPTIYDGVYFNTPIAVGGLILSGYYPVTALGAGQTQYYITASANATSTVSNGGAVPTFTTISGTSIVTVTLTAHGLAVGNTVVFPISTTVGGIAINGSYTVATVPTANTFTITTATVATSSAGPTGMNSGNCQLLYYITLGPSAAGIGYGTGSTYTVTFSNGSANISGTGLPTDAGQPCTFTTTGTLPTNFAVDTTYYILAGSTSTTLNVALTPGGIAIVAGSAGSGTHKLNLGYGVGTYGFGNVPTAQTGTTITANNWTIDNWGQFAVTCPQNGAVYYWDPNAGFSTLRQIQAAPLFNRGLFVSMPQQILVCYGSTVQTNLGLQQDPLLVAWSDQGNFESWTPLTTNQAGSYRIPTGSEIIGGLQGPQNGLIWTDLDLWSMNYLGYPLVFGFTKVGANCGLIGQHAATQLRGNVFWMGKSNFFMFNGNNVQIIQCPIWDYVFQNLDATNQNKCVAAANTAFNEVWWFFPSSSGTGEPNNYVKYNIVENTWDFGQLSRTAWIDQSVLGQPLAATANSVIYQHETTNDADGIPIISTMRTGYFVVNEGHEKTFIDMVWPDFKYGAYGDPNPDAQIQVTVYAADYPNDTPTVIGPYTVSPSQNTYFNTRVRNRLLALQFQSSDPGSFWRIGNVRIRFAQDGKV